MKHILLFAFLTVSLNKTNAQNVSVSGALSGNGSYATLSAAFTAINGGMQTNATITITIVANTTETATASLKQSTGIWTKVTIIPSGVRTIQGSIATSLVELNGADNVTIDGLNDGTNSLTIDNTNNGATIGTLRLTKDAQYNTIINCTLRGSSIWSNAAIIVFSTADITYLQGNDNNTITNCTLRESSTGNPIFGIYSSGTSGSPKTKWNSGNAVSNNQFINIVNLAAVNTAYSAGIELTNAANTDWTITGNSFYLSSGVTSSSAANNYGIRITGGNGNNFSITGNYFGGSASNCGGSPMTWSNTSNGNKYCGIYISVSATGTASSVQGNTISNITINTNSNAMSQTGIFAGISIDSGNVYIGTSSGNLIGSNTVNSSISIITAATSTIQTGAAYGIAILSTTTYIISNNQISGIKAVSTNNKNALNFYGIYIASGAGTISSNTIGSSTLSNSIYDSTGFNYPLTSLVTAIYQKSTASTLTISSNIISNITQATSNNVWQMNGITLQTGANSVTSNIISNLKNVSSNSVATSLSVIGINTNGTSAQTISGNSISNLQSTYSGAVASGVIAILFANSSIGHVVSQNIIYDLKNSNTGTLAPIDAIRISPGSGTLSVYNNMISIGNGLTNNPYINAINVQGGTPAIYYNSVALTGSATGSAALTNCLLMQAGNFGSVIENNILYNNRTSSNAANNAALYFTNSTQVSNATCNYNDLYKNAANTYLVIVNLVGNYSGLAAWQSSGFAKDAASITILPSFINIASDLHLTDDCWLSGKATIIPGISTDYDNETRSSFPDIGADEINIATWTGITSSDWNIASNWSPALVPTTSSEVLIPASTPYSCVIFSANATCHTITIFSSASFSMIGTYVLTINANCTIGGYANYGLFSAGSGLEEVAFNGLGIVLGTVTFNIVSTNNGLTFGTTTTTVNKKFRIDAGGYVVANPPIYSSGTATLQYNSGGYYGRYLEWCTTSGPGYPNHVQVSNSTTLDLGNGGTAIARKCGGNLIVDPGSTLTMDYAGNQMTDDLSVSGDILINGTLTQSSLATAPYNDINANGNWTRGASGTFNPNCRSVTFKNSNTNQTITVTGGGTEVFNYMTIDKSGQFLLFGPNTDVEISALNSCGLGNDYLTIVNGDIDLVGRTLTFRGPTGLSSGTLVMNMNVQNGTRTIITSVAGGIINVTSTLNSKTLTVVNGGSLGKILFDDNVEVRDANGEIDFGNGNLGTIKYILRINNGGAVIGNAPYYSQGSTLIYSTGTLYDLTSTEESWKTGTTGTTPGVPWNVEVNLALTDVRSSDNLDRCVRNDISILNGKFEQGAPGFLTGNLIVGGNWLRNNSGTSFIPNQNKVTFNSSYNAAPQLQTVTMSGGGNETFYDLEEDNLLSLTLSGTTNAYVTDHLYLTSGLINTSGNEVYVENSTAASITFDPSNGSADSWVNGYLRRAIATGSYDFPVGVAATSNASGYELLTLDFSSNTNIDNLRIYFTTDGTPLNEPYNVAVNGTTINDRLNAGWWTSEPYDQLLVLVAAPVCSYDVNLYERGHTNAQFSPSQYAVIKRNTSYCTDVCATAWSQCGIHNNATQWETGGTAFAARTGYSCNSFSDWAIGFADIVLPIELISFDVVKNDNDAFVTWSTSAEYNSSYFAVERSDDGILFAEIGTVPAAGFSSTEIDYSLTDPDITALNDQQIYYRLRIVNLDQSYSYSEVRVIELDGTSQADAVFIYPNPFTNEIHIDFNASINSVATIELNDVEGRQIIRREFAIAAGKNTIALKDIPTLSMGIYFIHVVSDKEVFSEKLLKEY